MIKFHGMARTLGIGEASGRMRETANAQLDEAPLRGMTETHLMGADERRAEGELSQPPASRLGGSGFGRSMRRIWQHHRWPLAGSLLGFGLVTGLLGAWVARGRGAGR